MFAGVSRLAAAGLLCVLVARPATVLVLQFHNTSEYSDLAWVGESIAQALMREYSAANQIVFDRGSRGQAMQRLSLRGDARLTKATLIRVGQTLDADYLCYGTYEANLPSPGAPLKESSISISAHLIDLKKMHDGPDFSEAGKISDLTRLEEHLAWETLKYLDPGTDRPLQNFITPLKITRLDAEESYTRGLLSTSPDQQQKWFLQAAALDPQFVGPLFELGKLALERKNYTQALHWLKDVPAQDPRYIQARFKMGLSAYGARDYAMAESYFREVLSSFPLNEVYNNLGAAEFALNKPAAVDDFRHALEGDRSDSAYLFNLGVALMKAKVYEEAEKRFDDVLSHNPNDAEARALRGQAQQRQMSSTGTVARVKLNFDETAFRQLKAVLQSK